MRKERERKTHQQLALLPDFEHLSIKVEHAQRILSMSLGVPDLVVAAKVNQKHVSRKTRSRRVKTESESSLVDPHPRQSRVTSVNFIRPLNGSSSVVSRLVFESENDVLHVDVLDSLDCSTFGLRTEERRGGSDALSLS